MNERVMQFKIGLFVMVAGMVLLMLVIWFGESPSLFRDHAFVKVRYAEAPGVAEGVTVRKSGIRIGEVLSIAFDDRPNQPDGVLVILSLERKYKLRKDSKAKISRSLIGDVSIDMLPGISGDNLQYGETPQNAPEIEGEISPDPSKMLAAANAAFEKVGGTLASIKNAADSFAAVAKKAEKIDEFMDTFGETGRNVSAAAKGINKVIAENEVDIRPAIANLRQVAEKLASAFDPETTARIKEMIARLDAVSARLDDGIKDLSPVFKDLGEPATKSIPTTSMGQAVYRINRIAADMGLLTAGLSDGKGRLNPNGTIQQMVLSKELYDNLNRAALSMNEILALARPVVRNLITFSERISKDPGAISSGVLKRN